MESQTLGRHTDGRCDFTTFTGYSYMSPQEYTAKVMRVRVRVFRCGRAWRSPRASLLLYANSTAPAARRLRWLGPRLIAPAAAAERRPDKRSYRIPCNRNTTTRRALGFS
jgi:hypothetical protein